MQSKWHSSCQSGWYVHMRHLLQKWLGLCHPSTCPLCRVLSGKRGVLKRPWSEAERVAVETHLNRNIVELRVPAKADCERCLQLCPLLVSNQRDWRAIKFYCHNRIQLLKKQGRRESAGQGGAA